MPDAVSAKTCTVSLRKAASRASASALRLRHPAHRNLVVEAVPQIEQP